MQDVDQPRFNQLRLRQRRDDAKNRFACEKRGSLGDGMNLAAEAESAKIIEEVFVESAGALEPIDVGGREAKIFEEIQRLLRARRRAGIPAAAAELRTNSSNTAVSVSP